jgi:hypothetical protein
VTADLAANKNRMSSKEDSMKNYLQDEMKGRAFKSVARAAVMFLAIGIIAAPSLFAKPKEKKAAGSNLGIIAHVPLDGGAVTRMVLVHTDGKEYLYVGFGSSPGVCIFDVTKPATPRKIEKFAGASGERTADLQLVGDTLAVMTRTEDGQASSSDAAPRSVTIFKTTDPANPQPIQTFSGVTSVVGDSERGQIYLSNGEGLWIVQTKQQSQQADPSGYGG